ncbi:hypothetical protein LEN26_002454 [Aphanomyces euteiches]|nr:hypothetical protein LEN26_002454 [Aphanomyces euteiches]
MPFPLPADFFRCPPLHPDDGEALRTIGGQNSIDVIRYARLENGPIKWSLDADDSDLLIYQGRDPYAPPGVVSWIGITEVMANLTEVSSLFHADTHDAFRDKYQAIFTDVLDVATLYTLNAPSEEFPRHFLGVRWQVMSSPAAGVAKHRDMCILESHHDFEAEDKRGWVIAFKSIELSACPDLYSTLGLVRCVHHRSGIVFTESVRPGYLMVAQLIQCNLGGSAPSWFMGMTMKRRCRLITQLTQHIRLARLNGSHFLAEDELIPRAARSRCFLCQKGFHLLNPKSRCRKCGEVICRSCSKVWQILVAGLPTKLRICTACAIATDAYEALTNSIMQDVMDDDGRRLRPQSGSNFSLRK